MRLVGLILALGAVGWLMYQASGGGKSETAIPQEYQRSLEKAQSVEQLLQQNSQQRLKGLDDSGALQREDD